jgi:hypothetical protein
MQLARSVLALSILAAPAAAQCDIQAIQPAGIGPGERFGASVSVRGDDGLVGAPQDASSGTVRVLRRVGDVWSQDQALVPSDPSSGAQFGSSLALFGDLALVGAPAKGGGGAAYLFQRTAGVWSQKQKLVVSGLQPEARFGFAVALSGDLLLVGAPGHPTFDAGAAYVFELSGGTWVQTAQLTASDASAGAGFGSSAAVEGGLALIGAPSTANGGAAYFFSKETGSWAESERIEASDAQPGAAFGADVSLSLPFALVGAPETAGGGAAYILEQGPGGWSEDDKLAAEDTEEFGHSVSLVSGALIPAALVGDPARGLFGSTFLFRHELQWVQRAKFTVSLAGGFGTDVSAGGGSAMVGAPSDAFGGFGGFAHAFTLVPQDISQVQAIPSFYSDAVGGLQAMFFDTCVGFAGNAYIVLGSASGTTPGTTIGDAFVPLNPDGYFGLTLQGTSPALYIASGAIRSDGLAQTYFFLLPGSLSPGLIGLKLHHAFVVFDHFTGEYLFASDPMPLDLLP